MIAVRIPAERLLKMVDEFGSIGRVQRKWAWVNWNDQALAFMPIHGVDDLFRGQSRRYAPCQANICRDIATPSASLHEWPRFDALRVVHRLAIAQWFMSQLEQLPIIRWANTRGFHIDLRAIAQHYGVPSQHIDLTEALEVAVFFATCIFDGHQWNAATEGEGILYQIDWQSPPESQYARANAINLQPFDRPYQQWAWTMALELGEDFEQQDGLTAAIFEHDGSVGQEMLRRFHDGADIFPPDPIAIAAARLAIDKRVPLEVLQSVAEKFAQDPRGLTGEDPVKIVQEIITQEDLLARKLPPTLWTEEELNEAETAWQSQSAKFEQQLRDESTIILVRDAAAEPPNAG